MANPIVTSLPNYTEEHRLPLIAKSVLGAKTASLLSLETGVKGPTALNLLSTSVVFQNGDECGWSAQGTTTLSQRVIKPRVIKINQNFCEKQLLKTWANYEVKVAAGDKTVPFEKDFTDDIVKHVQEGVEKMIWAGNSDNPNECDGFIKILSEGGSTAKVVANAKGTAAYKAIKDVYMAIPEEALKEDTVIFVGAGMFRQFIQELVAGNMYHYNANDKDGEYMLPGTNVKVIAVNGLNNVDANNDYIVAGQLSNMFYGTDMQGDEEQFDLWYSKDNQEERLAIQFTVGVQVAYPDQIVLGKVAKK